MDRFPKSTAQIEELRRYVKADPYPFVLDLANSRGMYLATADGQRIFDWAGYYGAKLLTHNHPGLQDPAYLRELALAANNKIANPDFLTPQCLAYYRMLYENAPRCMRGPELEVYAVNSGAEAVENMMKYFIVLHDEKMIKRGDVASPRRFLYFDRAFHGRTIFALNVTQLTHDPIVTKDFQGIVPGNLQIKFPSVDTSQPPERNEARTDHCIEIVRNCLEQHGHEIVAIVAEPIQGAGGHRVALSRFFQALSRLAHEHDVFLGFDEVQTAGGQTGAMFMCDQLDLPFPPQAIAVAKKFGNGVVYMRNTVGDRGVLDSTWGGCLADMVRVCREFEIVRQERLIEQVPAKTVVLVEGLQALTRRFGNLLFNVRGQGLYQGFTMRNPAHKAKLVALALEHEDMLLLGAGAQSIRFRPPLDVSIEEIRLMIEKLCRCLERLAADAPPANGASDGEET